MRSWSHIIYTVLQFTVLLYCIYCYNLYIYHNFIYCCFTYNIFGRHNKFSISFIYRSMDRFIYQLSSAVNSALYLISYISTFSWIIMCNIVSHKVSEKICKTKKNSKNEYVCQQINGYYSSWEFIRKPKYITIYIHRTQSLFTYTDEKRLYVIIRNIYIEEKKQHTKLLKLLYIIHILFFLTTYIQSSPHFYNILFILKIIWQLWFDPEYFLP